MRRIINKIKIRLSEKFLTNIFKVALPFFFILSISLKAYSAENSDKKMEIIPEINSLELSGQCENKNGEILKNIVLGEKCNLKLRLKNTSENSVFIITGIDLKGQKPDTRNWFAQRYGSVTKSGDGSYEHHEMNQILSSLPFAEEVLLPHSEVSLGFDVIAWERDIEVSVKTFQVPIEWVSKHCYFHIESNGASELSLSVSKYIRHPTAKLKKGFKYSGKVLVDVNPDIRREKIFFNKIGVPLEEPIFKLSEALKYVDFEPLVYFYWMDREGWYLQRDRKAVFVHKDCSVSPMPVISRNVIYEFSPKPYNKYIRNNEPIAILLPKKGYEILNPIPSHIEGPGYFNPGLTWVHRFDLDAFFELVRKNDDQIVYETINPNGLGAYNYLSVQHRDGSRGWQEKDTEFHTPYEIDVSARQINPAELGESSNGLQLSVRSAKSEYLKGGNIEFYAELKNSSDKEIKAFQEKDSYNWPYLFFIYVKHNGKPVAVVQKKTSGVGGGSIEEGLKSGKTLSFWLNFSCWSDENGTPLNQLPGEYTVVFEYINSDWGLSHYGPGKEVTLVRSKPISFLIRPDGWLSLAEALRQGPEAAKEKIIKLNFIYDVDHFVATGFYDGNLHIVYLFIASGMDVNLRDNCGFTPLLFFVWKNRSAEMVDALLNARANPNSQLDKIETCYNYKEIEKYLGFTPLMFAVENNNKTLVEILLKKGANPKMKNQNGKTAIDFANELNRQELVEMLVKGSL